MANQAEAMADKRRLSAMLSLASIGILVSCVILGLIAESWNSDQRAELYEYPMTVQTPQQSQQQLAQYMVSGAVNVPETNPAPPQGIVMQFPGAQVGACGAPSHRY